MQTIVLLATLVAAALAIPSDTYDVKYDDFNAEEMTHNTRLLGSHGKCYISEGPCTAEAAEIKKLIPEALQTKCGKCTPKQRKLVRIMVRAFQNDLPEIWTKLELQHDPEGKYKASIDDFLNADD